MAQIKTVHLNLLEAATVTLTAGAAAAGYPLYRLYDRDIGRPFVGSAAATTTIHVDQGATGAQAVDRVIIAGHNLAGETIAFEHSANNTDWTAAVTPFVATAADMNFEVTGGVKRYWRWPITSPAAAPSVAELWLGPTETWTREAARPGGAQEDVHNVTVAVTATARPRFEVNGPSLRQFNFTLSRINSSQRTALESLWSVWAGSKPFWICSPEGVWCFIRPTSPLSLREVGAGTYDAAFSALEVPA